jgi:hypothetical protein
MSDIAEPDERSKSVIRKIADDIKAMGKWPELIGPVYAFALQAKFDTFIALELSPHKRTQDIGFNLMRETAGIVVAVARAVEMDLRTYIGELPQANEAGKAISYDFRISKQDFIRAHKVSTDYDEMPNFEKIGGHVNQAITSLHMNVAAALQRPLRIENTFFDQTEDVKNIAAAFAQSRIYEFAMRRLVEASGNDSNIELQVAKKKKMLIAAFVEARRPAAQYQQDNASGIGLT